MTLFFSFLSVLIALAALWFAMTAMKKSDDDIAEFGNLLRRDIGAVQKEIQASMGVISRNMTRLEKRLEKTREVGDETRHTVRELQAELSALKSSVAEIDASIPPQFRRRTQTPEHHVKN